MANHAYIMGQYFSSSESNIQQCSAGGEFCLFCKYRQNEDTSAENDGIADLKAKIRIMLREKKERVEIVRLVHQEYQQFKSEIEWVNHKGQLEQGPEWTMTSIERHLVFSTEFKEFFANEVENVYVNAIEATSRQLFNDDGSVDPKMMKHFKDWTHAYKQWRA